MKKLLRCFLCTMFLFVGAFNIADAQIVQYSVTGLLSYDTTSIPPDALGLDGASFSLITSVNTNSVPYLDGGPPDFAYFITNYRAESFNLHLSGTAAGAYDGNYSLDGGIGFIQLDRGVSDDRMFIETDLFNIGGSELYMYNIFQFDPGFLGDPHPFALPDSFEIDPTDVTGLMKGPQISNSVRYNIVVSDASGSPVPEPTTMLLFGAGLVGLAGFGRKKFKK